MLDVDLAARTARSSGGSRSTSGRYMLNATSAVSPEALPGPLHRFLQEDHRRLEDLLRCSVDAEAVEVKAYELFRAGLLRHIAMEEKVLLPEARRLRGGESLAVAKQLRADHAALASLLVPTPTKLILAAIREVLEEHNPLEEGPAGLYAVCEQLAGPSWTP